MFNPFDFVFNDSIEVIEGLGDIAHYIINYEFKLYNRLIDHIPLIGGWIEDSSIGDFSFTLLEAITYPQTWIFLFGLMLFKKFVPMA